MAIRKKAKLRPRQGTVEESSAGEAVPSEADYQDL